MKKFLFALIMIAFPIFVNAYDVKIDGICYNLHPSTLEADVTYNIVSDDGAWYSDYSGDVVIPSTVNSDGNTYTVSYVTDNAFARCSDLKSVVLPNTIKKMGLYVFEDCTNLTSVTLPNDIEELGNLLFAGCISLPSVTIPGSVKKIGPSAFSECNSMKTITIPPSVIEIDDWAFCYGEGLTEITIPSTVKRLGKGVFLDCRNLKKVELPTSIDELESEMFEGCTSMETLVIPDNYEIIGKYAFSGCYKMTSITIGSKITSIGDKSFTMCKRLKEIVSRIEDPFDVSNVDFPEEIYDQAVLYVPVGTVDKYKATEGWKRFFKIVEIGTIIPCKINVEINADGGHIEYNQTKITENKSTIECNPGSDVTFKLVPNDGWTIGMVWLGWEDMTDKVSGDNTFTIENVRDDFDLWVVFNYMGAGVSDIQVSDKDAKIYDLNGRPQKLPQKGLYIIREKDGVTKKKMMK